MSLIAPKLRPNPGEKSVRTSNLPRKHPISLPQIADFPQPRYRPVLFLAAVNGPIPKGAARDDVSTGRQRAAYGRSHP
jgi:hypothetical protein